MMGTGLQGRVALVTGANHGIGAATAKALASEGAKVFITYLCTPPEHWGVSEEAAKEASTPGLGLMAKTWATPAAAVVQEIRDTGGAAEAWEADLADPSRIPEVFDRAEAAFGPVDILVNNATHSETPATTILTTSAEVFDRYFAVNTRATVLMMKEFLTRHKERGATWGRIINLSQDAAQVAGNHIAYSSTKATIEMLTRAAVWRAGPMGITVNAVAPGPVQTGYLRPEQVEAEAAELPLRRIGEPEDIANAIVFLASGLAGWITGQVIKVDGGHGFNFK